MGKIQLVILTLLFTTNTFSQFVVKKQINIPLNAPASIASDPALKQYYIASEKSVSIYNEQGALVLQKIIPGAYDLKGISKVGSEIYVVDERYRMLFVLKAQDLSVIKNLSVPYSKGLDEGYETVFFNPVRERITLITEKQPVTRIEIDYEFNITSTEVLKSFKEVSDAVFFDNALWILSDEYHRLYKVDAMTYEIQQSWDIPLLNPEGLFLIDAKKMELGVLSKDQKILYFIALKEQSNELKLF